MSSGNIFFVDAKWSDLNAYHECEGAKTDLTSAYYDHG